MVLYHLGSDDGGVTWRQLKRGENPKLYVAICERDDAQAPRNLQDAINLARADAFKAHSVQ